MSQFASTHPSLIVAIVFAAIVLCAVAFVAWPAWRVGGHGRVQRVLLSLALATFVVGTGVGVYLLVGSPELAREAVAGPMDNGIKGLVIELARRMRERPHDVMGWALLGRGYLTLGDPGQAAIAFQQASALAPAEKKPELLSAFGEATTLAAGRVTPEAESAFREALAGNRNDFAAEYYLGRAYAERGDKQRARELWTKLLAQAPPAAPWRADVISRLAALQPPPMNVRHMVEGLEARLHAHPDDPAGWQELLRSYAVLGEKEKAMAALVEARTALRDRPTAEAAVETEARSLKLVPSTRVQP